VQLYPQNRLFGKAIFWPLRGAAPRNFYTCHRMAKFCCPYPTGDKGSPNNFFQWRVKYWLKI